MSEKQIVVDTEYDRLTLRNGDRVWALEGYEFLLDIEKVWEFFGITDVEIVFTGE